MKNLIVGSLVILLAACSKETPAMNNSDNLDAAPQMTYDTIAIDSFGPGATSESVMAKINAVAIKREQDSLAKIAKAEQEKLDKEKTEKEAEKAKEAKTETPKTAAGKPAEEQKPVTTP